MPAFDLVLRNGSVVDGTGGLRYRGTVAIDGDTIGLVCEGTPDLAAQRTIDCTGLVISPGFVDPHSHTDRSIAANPDNENSIRNGITSEVTGQCGTSAAPGEHGVAEWFDQLDEMTCGNNLALMVGQGTVRKLVMGEAERRFANGDELRCQMDIVERAMRDGCVGITSGRAYIPGCFASTWECIRLATVVAEYSGVYSFHIQNQNEYVADATREALEIGRRADIPVLIAHQKIMGKNNWGRAAEIVREMELAREAGVRVMSDVYPYDFSAVIDLADRVLPSARVDGADPAEMAAQLEKPEAADRLHRFLAGMPQAGGNLPYFHNLLPQYGVVWCEKTKEYEGFDLREVAAQMGCDLYQAVINVLRDNDLGVKLAGIMSEEDLQTFLKWECAMVGTDSSARDPKQDQASAKTTGVHPRCYGTHTRVLGRYVRELGLLGLEEAICKMTSMPADFHGLADRGRLRANLAADVVVFDPHTVSDRSTVEDPAALPVGIRYVVINGKLAIDGGQLTRVRSGKTLRDLQGRYPYE